MTISKRLFSSILTAGLWLPALAASAHPGHDILDHGADHVLISPYHLAALALGGSVILGAARLARGPVVRMAARLAGAAALIAAGVLWTLGQ